MADKRRGGSTSRVHANAVQVFCRKPEPYPRGHTAGATSQTATTPSLVGVWEGKESRLSSFSRAPLVQMQSRYDSVKGDLNIRGIPLHVPYIHGSNWGGGIRSPPLI